MKCGTVSFDTKFGILLSSKTLLEAVFKQNNLSIKNILTWYYLGSKFKL